MNASIKLGYKASNEQFAPQELLDYGVLAEQCGFDSVFVSDHLQPWRHDCGHAPFPMTLAGCSRRADRADHDRYVDADADVSVPPGDRGATVRDARLPPSGTGCPGHGQQRVDERGAARHRVARRQGAVRPVPRGRQAHPPALAGGAGVLRGDYYCTDKATIYDCPEQPVPIWLASSGPAATRFAGRQGDGWITTSGKGPAICTDTLMPGIAEGAEASGRSTSDIEMMIENKVSDDHDRNEAMRATHFWGALGLTAEQRSGVEDPVEMQRLADELSVEQTAKRFIVSTDPDEHVKAIKGYLDLGFNHLVFHAPGPGQERFLRLYGAGILPPVESPVTAAPDRPAPGSDRRAARSRLYVYSRLPAGCPAPLSPAGRCDTRSRVDIGLDAPFVLVTGGA